MNRGTKHALALIASLIGISIVFAFAFLGASANWRVETRIARPTDETGAASAASHNSSDRTQYGIWHPVVRIVDGDTIVVAIDGENTKVRLIGLDTPEVVDPRKQVQCFGREASAKAEAMLDGQLVRLEKDPSQGDFDKYGRTLAYVFLHDGTNFNEFMIAQGYGHEYTYDMPYKYQARFKAAEKTAREQKLGLWADNTCAGNTKKPE